MSDLESQFGSHFLTSNIKMHDNHIPKPRILWRMVPAVWVRCPNYEPVRCLNLSRAMSLMNYMCSQDESMTYLVVYSNLIILKHT